MSDSIIPIVMPKLGLSMTEGSVAAWYVSPGSSITSGDVVADIETSKITNELEVFASGTFRRAVVELGVEVPVGALIGVIANASVAEAEIDAFVAAYSPDGGGSVGETPLHATESSVDEVAVTSGVVTAAREEQSGSVPDELSGSYDEQAVFASHHAHKLAATLGIDLSKVTGTGRAGRISRNDVTAAVAAAGGSLATPASAPSFAPTRSRDAVKTTPVARRLADEHGIDLADVAATGSRGRISKGDVLAYIEKRETSSATPPAETLVDNAFVEEALSSTRKVIARRLAESKTTAPHYRLSVDVIIDKLLELRSDINGSETQTRVSVNDMLIRAAALALLENPAVNVQFDGQTIRRFTHADVAVAVALEDGLVTPIVRNADQKELLAIARESADLAERARSGGLLPDEFTGGTFTLSNLGMFGIKSFDAIINPPQAAIMAVGKAERRLYVGEEDSGKVATFMTVTLACDHRVIDGATGAKFLSSFKDILQHPGRLLL